MDKVCGGCVSCGLWVKDHGLRITDHGLRITDHGSRIAGEGLPVFLNHIRNIRAYKIISKSEKLNIIMLFNLFTCYCTGCCVSGTLLK